jgi:hypothetical protein
MKFKITLLLLSICLSSYAQSLPSGFETVAYEGFVYNDGQDLINVGGGTGWTTNWQQFYQNKYLSARNTSYTYSGLSTTTGGKATFDNSCYGSCNDISSSGRKLTATTEGVLYLQFLADLGSQEGGGTPHVRLDFNGSTTVVLGKIDDGHNWVLYDSNTATSASTNISGYSTVRLVIVRFDYTNNTMRMYIDPNLSTFDYSNPSGHNAEISGISIPYFDEIGPMFRTNGTPGIDEIHVFKESSETFTNSSGDGQWDTASNWSSGSVPSSSENVTISSGQTIEAGASLGNSIYFDGVDDYLTFSNLSGEFEATGDFTFEAWVNWTTLVNGAMSPIFGGQTHAYVALYNQKAIRIDSNNQCGGDQNFGSFASITTNEWHHIAVVRSGSTITWYTDGISDGTNTCSGPWFDDGGTMYIGKSIFKSGFFHGYMKNIRYVDGTAVYTSNFTPPGTVSNITNTTFLMNVNSSSTYLTDTSSSGYTVTGYGGPTFTASNGPSGSGNSTTAVANNLTIDSGGSLTIASNSDLTLSGNFTNNGTMTLNSDSDEFSSIIVGGSSSGDIVYNRYVNTVGTDEWDLVGSPVDGLSISDFVTTNSSVLATNGSTYAIGYHDNTDDSWTNYTTSTVGGAGNFDTSRGYQMATSSGATMAFTGSIATTDQTQSIINNNGNGGRRWNLVANPYPSYLNANTNANASNNFLSVNASVIDSNFLSIYGWDADGSGYTIYNNTSSATYIAPGQAFFVAAASSSAANLSFTEAMQTTTGGDDFINLDPGNTSSEFILKFHQGDNLLADTKFYFDYGLNPSLDPGYDAGALNQNIALTSRLAEEDQGINMGINAMSIDSFEQTAIALVVNTESGTTFRISMEDSTIPENVDVFLLDTQTQISTNLRDQDFILTPQSDLSGMGRFYLKMGSNSLGGNDIEESLISIYKPSDRDCIVIEGLSNVQSGEVTLYNIMGQEVIGQNLTPNQTTQNIPTTGIQSGIYIIKLKADTLVLTKKLVIK